MSASTQESNATAGSKPIKSLAGIRPSVILEIGLFLGLTLAIDQIFFDGTRFRSTPEHPFWILVLLISAQYGTNAGLLAAFASSAALLIGNIPPQSLSQDHFTYVFEVIRLPLLWFVSAVVLGELRVQHIRRRERVERELADTVQRERTLAEAYKRMTAVKEALETRMSAQLRSALNLYQAARAIEKLEPSEVLLGVADLIRSIMNPEKFSVYLLRNGSLDCIVENGWSAEDHFPKSYAAGTPLFREIAGGQRVLSVSNPDDAIVLAGAGIMAAPLVAPDTGRVLGMLKIEQLRFLDLNFSNLQTLKALSHWIGAAYDNALRYQAARSESVINSETDLLAYGFLSRQLTFLTTLARRIGFDLSMIVVRLENSGELNSEERAMAPRIFSQAVSGALRKTDLAFDYQRTGTEFAIILPGTAVSEARVVVRKLEFALASQNLPARFSFAIQAIHELPRAEQALELQRA